MIIFHLHGEIDLFKRYSMVHPLVSLFRCRQAPDSLITKGVKGSFASKRRTPLYYSTLDLFSAHLYNCHCFSFSVHQVRNEREKRRIRSFHGSCYFDLHDACFFRRLLNRWICENRSALFSSIFVQREVAFTG